MPFSCNFKSAVNGSIPMVPAVDIVPFSFNRRDRLILPLLFLPVEMVSPFNVKS